MIRKDLNSRSKSQDLDDNHIAGKRNDMISSQKIPDKLHEKLTLRYQLMSEKKRSKTLQSADFILLSSIKLDDNHTGDQKKESSLIDFSETGK